MVCHIADAVLAGGIRRAALISLFSADDSEMLASKTGNWWETNPQRGRANNSVVLLRHKIDRDYFMNLWERVRASGAGEPGFYFSNDKDWGTNPCCEIGLRPYQFCNLTEVVVRATDNVDDLKRKVRIATILGTIQSTLVNFKYVSKHWKQNCEEERLLGVSLTGIMDSVLTSPKNKDLKNLLKNLKKKAIDTNRKWCKIIGIPVSAAITCVKPSGTVSQLTDAASGIHARHNPYYIRTVRGDKKDPLTMYMTAAGFPVEDDVMNPNHTSVFSFPMKVDTKAIFRTDMTAIEQLEHWLMYQIHWCEHKPSVTISVKEHEWMEVGAWVYDHFDWMSGVSFLPFSEHTYQQAPYQDCGEKDYKEMLSKMPTEVEWTKLAEYETQDMTVGAQELACTAGGCEI